MVEDARDLAKHGADPLGALGHLDVEQLLDGARVAQLVGHHRNVVESVKVRQRLRVRLVLDQLLRASVQERPTWAAAAISSKASARSNVIAEASWKNCTHVRTQDLLSVELEDQTQHTVGGGCWGPKLTVKWRSERSFLEPPSLRISCALRLCSSSTVKAEVAARWAPPCRPPRWRASGARRSRADATTRGCAGSVQLRSRSDGAEERRRHDDVDSCVCRLGRRRGVAGGQFECGRCNQRSG